MGIKLSKEELWQYAIDSLPKHIPTISQEQGFMNSNLTIGGYDYRVTYLKNVSTGIWFVSTLINADGTPID